MSSPPPKSRSTNLCQAMLDFFYSLEGADITFVVHGIIFKAHKFILTMRSSVLKAMIEGPMAPADQRHEINYPEITADDFENFLKFLYTDKCDIEEDNFKVMLHLGNFYDVPYLHEKCSDAFEDFEIQCKDALRYAEMALLYAPASTSLFQKCFSKFSSCQCDNPKSLSYLDYDDDALLLKWISAELVLEFVKQFSQSHKTFTEDEFFKMVFRWTNNECIHRDLKPREIMEPFMLYLEPQKFSPLTLATDVKNFKLIPDDQLVKLLAENIVEVFDADKHVVQGNENN